MKKSNELTHTPVPWHLVDDRQICGLHGQTIADVTDTTEGLEGSDGEADANAIFIVNACNANKYLLAKVAALERTIDGMISQVAGVASRIGVARLPESIREDLNALVNQWRFWQAARSQQSTR